MEITIAEIEICDNSIARWIINPELKMLIEIKDDEITILKKVDQEIIKKSIARDKMGVMQWLSRGH
jgi:hypothetical protein